MSANEMTVRGARKWLLLASLVFTGATWLFFLVAPVCGYPLTFSEAFDLIKAIIPVFVGYLGLAVGFATADSRSSETRETRMTTELMALLVRGPVLLYAVMMISIVTIFGVSNRSGLIAPERMSYDFLKNAVTVCAAVLAGSTSLLAVRLYSRR
jgi:hypothetical protein